MSPLHDHKLTKLNHRSRPYSSAVEAFAWFFNVFRHVLDSRFLCSTKESRLAKFLLTMAKLLSSKEMMDLTKTQNQLDVIDLPAEQQVVDDADR